MALLPKVHFWLIKLHQDWLKTPFIKRLLYPLLLLIFILIPAQITSSPLVSADQPDLQLNQLLLPTIKDSKPSPLSSASAYLIYDLSTRTILAQKNAATSLPAASTAKIATALVVRMNYPLDQVIGDYTVTDWLKKLLIESDNQAAYILAQAHPQGLTGFVNDLNLLADKLSLTNSHFDNPAGFDSANQYLSAGDLNRLVEYLLADPLLRQIVTTIETTVTNQQGQVEKLTTTNQLLGAISGVSGIKTGTTPEAGECLITLYEHQGKPIIITILGSANRYYDTKNFISWVNSNLSWQYY